MAPEYTPNLEINLGSSSKLQFFFVPFDETLSDRMQQETRGKLHGIGLVYLSTLEKAKIHVLLIVL